MKSPKYIQKEIDEKIILDKKTREGHLFVILFLYSFIIFDYD
jgi:hypothetical protein